MKFAFSSVCLVLVAVPAVATVACGDDASATAQPTPSPDQARSDGGASAPGPGSTGAELVGDSGGAGRLPDGGRDVASDPSAFYGASRCAGANLQLCDDFESGTLDRGTWSIVGTAPVIDGVHAARGDKALHITKNGNGLSYLKEAKTFPAVDNAYYGRMFVYFESLPTPAMGYAHWTLVEASGSGGAGVIRVGGQQQTGKNLFGVGSFAGPTGDWTNSDADPKGAPVAVPTKVWMCLEWMHDGASDETRFWWDGVEHPSLYTSLSKHGYGNGGSANAPYAMPNFTNVLIGWGEYQRSSQKFELWIDEVAIDTDRIGCAL